MNVLEKPVKFSVAAVVRSPLHPGTFLAVQRPQDDDHLPGVWGLPAVSLAAGELPESGLRRLGEEKLGVPLAPVSFVGVRAADRGDYLLILMDLEAVPEGEPDVHAARTAGTAYVDQRWTGDLGLLVEAARMGSVCCRILLQSEGVDWGGS